MSDDAIARGPPHALILGAVIVFAMVLPFLLGEDGLSVIPDFISDAFGAPVFLLLPVLLLLVIRFLSSDRGTALSDVFLAGGQQDTIHRVGGSPVGVAVVLVVLLLLLYFRVSLFRGGGDDGDE
ncbi:hypothetical protein QJS04_geneDACA007256 [Acorus gramineus]|uniref:Uncharacterized protein n=1 Tax=Acorus gramineus TaxID=55184 RepID=A0AAV8ZV44_ACOGR|nr:hypothetical protein QJS04_geneDACA024873 [Acorus gramineus]KAK1278772.1 hypothetical protein QJS04_geneDACA007256 [Acorus gramineus]